MCDAVQSESYSRPLTHTHTRLSSTRWLCNNTGRSWLTEEWEGRNEGLSLIRKIYFPKTSWQGWSCLVMTSPQLSSLITCLRPSEHKVVILNQQPPPPEPDNLGGQKLEVLAPRLLVSTPPPPSAVPELPGSAQPGSPASSSWGLRALGTDPEGTLPLVSDKRVINKSINISDSLRVIK